MPLKLIPPSARSKVYRVRGTHRGVYLDRTTGIAIRARAEALRKKWEIDIEDGELSERKPLTFADAALAFVRGGGERRFLKRITDHFGPRFAAKDITQAILDAAAAQLYPQGSPATLARQVYAPVTAVLRHNGITTALRKPKGHEGNRRTVWLTPEQFERLYAAACAIDAEMATMMLLCCYTGMRLGEALALRCCDIKFVEAEAMIHRTKNGDPRAAHLPPRILAALASHPRGIDRDEQRVFRFTKNGALNRQARSAYIVARVDCGDAPFHVLRHTWATWMVRLGVDLVATKAWRSTTSARGYTHFVTSEEARKANYLPGALLITSASAVRSDATH